MYLCFFFLFLFLVKREKLYFPTGVLQSVFFILCSKFRVRFGGYFLQKFGLKWFGIEVIFRNKSGYTEFFFSSEQAEIFCTGSNPVHMNINRPTRTWFFFMHDFLNAIVPQLKLIHLFLLFLNGQMNFQPVKLKYRKHVKQNLPRKKIRV